MFLVFSNVHISESYLQYNLIVTVKPKTTPIKDTDFPVIIGTVTDEASKPIEGAHVKITFAKEVVTTTTDQYGNFRYDSVLPILPGYYMINAIVTKDGYNTGLASSDVMVNIPTITYSKAISGDPIVSGNYTIYLGKVTDWNLETTCFVKFGDQFKRFLKTCDLYDLAPADFQTDASVVHSVAVIQHNGTDYRLFPVSDYFAAVALNDTAQSSYVYGVWGNYTAPN